MLGAGEDPPDITRRAVIPGSQDVGMADAMGIGGAHPAPRAGGVRRLPGGGPNLAHPRRSLAPPPHATQTRAPPPRTIVRPRSFTHRSPAMAPTDRATRSEAAFSASTTRWA